MARNAFQLRVILVQQLPGHRVLDRWRRRFTVGGVAVPATTLRLPPDARPVRVRARSPGPHRPARLRQRLDAGIVAIAARGTAVTAHALQAELFDVLLVPEGRVPADGR